MSRPDEYMKNETKLLPSSGPGGARLTSSPTYRGAPTPPIRQRFVRLEGCNTNSSWVEKDQLVGSLDAVKRIHTLSIRYVVFP